MDYPILQIKRGTASAIPALVEGEFSLSTDQKKIHIGHLDGDIELLTDQSGAVFKTNFGANSVLAANDAGVPLSLEIPDERLIGRKGGNITPLTKAEILDIINVTEGATPTNEANVNTAGATMNADTDVKANNWVIDEDTMISDLDTKVPTQQSVKAYVNGRVASQVAYKGGYNASTNVPDLDTAPSGIKTGFMYTVTAVGTFFTVELEKGDVLIAEKNDPTLESDWTIVNKNLDAPSIKTSYESNNDTNAFTDDEKSKLGLIEAEATADQAASEFNHNDLSEIQGGSALERYHLSAAEHAIATQAATNLLDGFLAKDDWGTFNNKANSGANIDITSLRNAVLSVGRDADNNLDWGIDNHLKINIGGVLTDITAFVKGDADNDKIPTQGYVNDAIGNIDLSKAFVDDTDTPNAVTMLASKGYFTKVDANGTKLEFSNNIDCGIF